MKTCLLSILASIFIIHPCLTLAEAVDYSGVYKVRMRRRKNTCGKETQRKVRGTFYITQNGTEMSSMMIREEEERVYPTTLTAKGFKLIIIEKHSYKKWGICTEKYKALFKGITAEAAKTVTTKYTEKCRKKGRKTWSCGASYQGRAKRS